MEILIYKNPFGEIPKQDNPQTHGDKSICICLIDGSDGEYETYEIIETSIEGVEHAMKRGVAYGLENAELMAKGLTTK